MKNPPPNSQANRSLIREDLAVAVSHAHGLALRQATRVVNAFLSAVVAALQDGSRVTLRGIGTLTPRVRPAREYRVPGSKRTVQSPPTFTIQFRRSRTLRARQEASRA
jgi:DNA-binding protein HU-beta